MIAELFLVAVTATCTAAATAIVTAGKVDAANRRAEKAEREATRYRQLSIYAQAALAHYKKPSRELSDHDCHWP